MPETGTSVNEGNRPLRGNGEGVAKASPLPTSEYPCWGSFLTPTYALVPIYGLNGNEKRVDTISLLIALSRVQDSIFRPSCL
uniref:Uncharacterized protein n=1 Tax=Candidatus Kentrum sp. LFY TaxID=2126342 RepID=A0A450V2L1_9GAMM|nr:MAG: hypothetical protein BECKLFY1418B_GA0070995_11351 [Candidatus Kentron sp. LFY]